MFDNNPTLRLYGLNRKRSQKNMQTHALSSPYRNLIGNLERRECTLNIVPQKKLKISSVKSTWYGDHLVMAIYAEKCLHHILRKQKESTER